MAIGISFLLLLAKAGEIKIGVNIPLTGSIKEYGIACLEGIKLALEKEKGIKLIIKDNEGKVKNASYVLKQLADEGVVVIIGPLISPSAVAVGIETKKFRIPIILPCATNTAITKVSDYMFRVCYTDKQQGEVLAKFIYQQLGVEKVKSIVDTTNIYSEGLGIYFKQKLESLSGEVEVVNWDGKRSLEEELKSSNNGVVFLPLYYKPVIDIIKTTKKLGLNIIFIGGDGLDSPELIATLKENFVRVYFSTHFTLKNGEDEFSRCYQKKYNRSPNAFSALGYDAGKFLLRGLINTKKLTREGVFEALQEIKFFEGVSGSFTYNEIDNNPRKIVYIVEVKEGNVSLIGGF
jgi:branched-chain amino acid transport system substrate-binding protein